MRGVAGEAPAGGARAIAGEGRREEARAERIVLIKGDQDAKYSSIMAAMDDLRRVGIEDIGLITERRKAPGTAGGK